MATTSASVSSLFKGGKIKLKENNMPGRMRGGKKKKKKNNRGSKRRRG